MSRLKDTRKHHFHLYVLSLEEGKYYVGITSQTPEKRFEEHKRGIRPANWTRKYKPLKILDTKDLGQMTWDEAEAYENKVIRKYLKEKGINSARGGDLTEEESYVRRFGYFFTEWDWETLTTVVLLLVIIVATNLIHFRTRNDNVRTIPASSGIDQFDDQAPCNTVFGTEVCEEEFVGLNVAEAERKALKTGLDIDFYPSEGVEKIRPSVKTPLTIHLSTTDDVVTSADF